MSHTALNSAEDLQAALATKGKYVFIYVHDGTIPPVVAENAGKYSSSTVSYSLDVSTHTKPKEHLKITQTPTALVYKDGQEVKRESTINSETMKAITELLS